MKRALRWSAIVSAIGVVLASWSIAVESAVQQLSAQPAGRGQQVAQPTPPPKPIPPTPEMPPLPEPDNKKPATSVPPPIFPTAPAEDKQLIFERVYSYRRLVYKPAIVVQRVTRDQASEATPEQAFAAQLSAMQSGDYEWWLSTWDKASQKFQIERSAQVKRTPADWRAIWDRAYRGQQVRLIERIQTGPLGPYVMLVYEMAASGQPAYRSNWVSKEEAGRWVTTLDLSADPIFQFYDSGKDRVSITVR
jgi:hypothetical protein